LYTDIKLIAKIKIMKQISSWSKKYLHKDFYKNSDLILTLFIGIFLRVKDILKFEFWYEAFTGLMTKISRGEFLTTLKGDVHPPLYMILIRGWAYLFGTSDLALRAFSGMFGILALILIYIITKKLYSKKEALISLFLASVSPFLIQYSYEARSYSFFAFAVLLSFYFALNKNKKFFFISLILLINIHFMALLFLPGLTATYIWSLYLDNKEVQKNLKRQIFLDIAKFTLIIGFGIFTIKIVSANQTASTVEWARSLSFTTIPRSFTAHLFGVKSKLTGSDALLDYKTPINILYLGYIAFAGFVGATIYSLKKLDKQNFLRDAIVLGNMLLPQILLLSYGIFTKRNLYVERYLLPTSLFLFIYLGALLLRAKFETMAVCIVVYVFVLGLQTTPDYYQGLKLLKTELRYTPDQITFTKPIDYVIGKYYFFDMKDQLKIYDPENPYLTYSWWPFIDERDFLLYESDESQTKETIFVIPKRGYVPKNLEPISSFEEYGDYNLYITKN